MISFLNKPQQICDTLNMLTQVQYAFEQKACNGGKPLGIVLCNSSEPELQEVFLQRKSLRPSCLCVHEHMYICTHACVGLSVSVGMLCLCVHKGSRCIPFIQPIFPAVSPVFPQIRYNKPMLPKSSHVISALTYMCRNTLV